MNVLGNGLFAAQHHADALSVQEAGLSMERRLGASEEGLLVMQSNLANTYRALGREEEALRVRKDVYSGYLKLQGEEQAITLLAATNYADSLLNLKRIEEVKALSRKTIPVARRVLGECHDLTLRMRWLYAMAFDCATLDDFLEATTMLEDAARTARRVFGGEHPLTTAMEKTLEESRAVLRADAEVSKHMRSYLSPARLAICRQVCREWLRGIEDDLRESRATVRAGPRDAGRPGPA